MPSSINGGWAKLGRSCPSSTELQSWNPILIGVPLHWSVCRTATGAKLKTFWGRRNIIPAAHHYLSLEPQILALCWSVCGQSAGRCAGPAVPPGLGSEHRHWMSLWIVLQSVTGSSCQGCSLAWSAALLPEAALQLLTGQCQTRLALAVARRLCQFQLHYQLL